MKRKHFVAAALVSLALSAGIVADAQKSSDKYDTLTFVGTSSNGDFDEALNNALLQADQHFSTVGADIRYDWQMREVDGERGGFFFLNDLHVTITAKGSSEHRRDRRAASSDVSACSEPHSERVSGTGGWPDTTSRNRHRRLRRRR